AVLPPAPGRGWKGIALLLAGVAALLGLSGTAWVVLSRPAPEDPTPPAAAVQNPPAAEPAPVPAPPAPPAMAPAPPPETRNIVVCAAGQGHYRTLREALQKAQPGAVIRVRPGLYRESLVLDREVQLLGDGPSADVIVEGDGAPALRMQTEAATVRG